MQLPRTTATIISILLTLVNIGIFVLFYDKTPQIMFTKNENSTFSAVPIAYVADTFEPQEYITGVYDCKNFTADFIKFSEEYGFYCEQVSGCRHNMSMCHSWVRCDIEPQNLEFVDYRSEYPFQMKKK